MRTEVKPTSRCSERQARTSSSSAALLVAYTPMAGSGRPVDEAETSTARPRLRFRWGRAARTTSEAPTTLVRSVSSHMSAPASAMGTSVSTAVAYTTASRPPRKAAASATAASQAAGSRTSHTAVPAPGPASAAASASRLARRAANTTVAPRPAACRPTARPIPDDAPTTSTRRPSSAPIATPFSGAAQDTRPGHRETRDAQVVAAVADCPFVAISSMAEMEAAAAGPASTVDAVVVGAGFAGLYAIYKLRRLGFSVQAYEAAEEVGGTWWWNCYPGARCDVESLDYCYTFDADLTADWRWSERFPTQPEVLSYARHVADRFDLRRHIAFGTRVTSAHWDDEANLWSFTTDRGDRIRARYFVSAVGAISAPNVPDIAGLSTFEGTVLQTNRWPHDQVDLKGKRVAVIGTGSSGIQAIPEIATEADHLTVFQRTANFSCPARNGPIDPEREAAVRADYAGYRQACLKNGAGTPPSSCRNPPST